VVAGSLKKTAKQRLVAANPFRGITHRTGEPRRPMTDDEFHALLKAANAGRRKPAEDRYPNGRKVCPSDLRKRARVTAGERFRELLTFLRYTGARPGEASRLRWEDIDLEEKVIRILRHKTSKTQRVKKPRIIPLHPVVLTLLIEIKRRNENAEYVFLTQRKSLWKRCNLSLRMQRAREAAGVADDAKLYGLHHGFGTRAVLNGVDIKTLSELLGHTSTKMSEHYIHLGGQTTHLARAMEQVNRPTQPPDATTPREGAPRPDC